jgi:hypothetical protein
MALNALEVDANLGFGGLEVCPDSRYRWNVNAGACVDNELSLTCAPT